MMCKRAVKIVAALLLAEIASLAFLGELADNRKDIGDKALGKGI